MAHGILLTQDPIGLAGGVNLYEYAGSNPVSFDDPYGLSPCPPYPCKDAGREVVMRVGTMLAPAQRPLEIAGVVVTAPLSGGMGMMGRVTTGLALGTPLALRARQLAAPLGAVTRDKTTVAVARVANADGSLSTLVGSSEKVLRPAQRAALNAGEQAVTGAGHAEATVLQAAQQSGQRVLGVGASRPMCTGCQEAVRETGARVAGAVRAP